MLHIYAMKLRKLAKNAGPCEKNAGTYENAAFRWRSRCIITSLHNDPMATREMAALVWRKRNIFQLSAKIYVTLLQWKCRDYEIMQAPNRQCMQWKCGIFETMRPLHEYADFGWLCVELYDRIIAFFWRDCMCLSTILFSLAVIACHGCSCKVWSNKHSPESVTPPFNIYFSLCVSPCI